jgi:glycosyltransferase involved in cell wall biosynthesis
MRIVVNAQCLIKDKLEGLGWFSYEVLKRITTQHPEHEFIFVFDRKWDPEFIFSKNIKPVILRPPSRHPFLWLLRFNILFPFLLLRYKADLFLSPDGWIPLYTGVKTVNVIHDLNFEHYPQDLPFWYRNYYRKYFPRFARRATRLATVSEYSKADIVSKYHVPAEKIDVVYNGCNESFRPIGPLQQDNTRWQFCFNQPYFVFVGSLHPRKNLINLFKAFDIFKNRTDSSIKLVIVGEKRWWTEEIDRTYENLKYKDDVIFTGRVDENMLNRIIGSALAMTYVSYFEGFGIPILEAFHCETPLITSGVTSMPEIAGDAALFVDPFSPESISEAMLQIATNESLRSKLIVKGRIQKENFSWQRSSELLWNCVEKAMGKKQK